MHSQTHGQGNLVEDIVRIFDRLSEEDSVAAGGFGSERELAVEDLKDLSREELMSKFRRADSLLGTLWSLGAEIDNLPLMVALADARHRLEAAYELVRRGGDS